MQTPIAPPYTEALILNKKRAEKKLASDRIIHFDERDVTKVIDTENASSTSAIKFTLDLKNSYNPSTAAKTMQDKDNEEDIALDGLQYLYEPKIPDYYSDDEFEDELDDALMNEKEKTDINALRNLN